MLKRIIFDLDFTLVIWKEEYSKNTIDILKKNNLDLDYKKIDAVINSQEVKYDHLSKEQILKDLNDNVCPLITMEMLDEVLESQKKLSEYDPKVIDVLKYLSSKYEIVILTNYFSDVQKGRLEHAGFMPYIKEVHGGDDFKRFKPYPEGFIKAMGPYNANECLMIGDSVRCDINGALEVGIPAILIDNRHVYPDYKGKRIDSLDELKEML